MDYYFYKEHKLCNLFTTDTQIVAIYKRWLTKEAFNYLTEHN